MKNQLPRYFHSHLVVRYAGKDWAYTPTIPASSGFGLGVAVRDEPGYFPIGKFMFNVDSYDEAQAEADRLNGLLPLEVMAADRIIVSTMAAQNEAATARHG